MVASLELWLMVALLVFTLWVIFSPEWYRHRPLTHEIPTITREVALEPLRSTPLALRIITTSGSSGTDLDARIYQKVFQGSRIAYVDPDQPQSHPEAQVPAKVNLYIEWTRGLSEGLFPAQKHWLMVNQEFLEPNRTLSHIDLFICKSEYARQLVSDWARKNHLKGEVINAKHTSESVKVGPKDWNLFLHLAGKSWLKNTEAVLEAWISHKGFPELGSPVLLVTCRGDCLLESRKIVEWVDSAFSGSAIKKHVRYPNIMLAESLPEGLLKDYQEKAGFYVCPSAVEGYGHYLNEGRAAGAVVLATNAPPMNELVDPTTGILIEPSSSSPYGRLPGSRSYKVSAGGVAEAVQIAKSLPEAVATQMGARSRQRYLEDTQHMNQVLVNLVRS